MSPRQAPTASTAAAQAVQVVQVVRVVRVDRVVQAVQAAAEAARIDSRSISDHTPKQTGRSDRSALFIEKCRKQNISLRRRIAIHD